MEHTISPDQIIEGTGGCGRYQIRLSVLIHVIKTAITWSVMTMAVFSKTPSWWCTDDVIAANVSSHSNDSAALFKSCLNRNGSVCKRYAFDDSMRTIVNEFGLVCDKAFIPSTIMSIQTAGMLFGNPLSGHVADRIGRKKPVFISLLFLTLSNLVCFFATNWILLAVCWFFIGIGASFFLTVQYSLLSEFTLATWRPWTTGFPSWPLQASLFAFIAWLLLDWRYMHLTCCIFSATCLLSWKLIPESFRWYLSHQRYTEADNVIRAVADVNLHKALTLQSVSLLGDEGGDERTTYTFFHLFKNRYLAKVTILCATMWLTLGFVSFGLLFGIQALSGNIFVNMFLFQISGIPAGCVASFLMNRIGRRKTSLLCFTMTFISGCIAGLVQYIDTGFRDEFTNGFALVASIGIAAAWPCVQTMTIELYPTVIRNIGYGTLNTFARVGGVIGPQMSFLDTIFPGTLYFVSGVMSAACMISLLFLPETKERNLQDQIKGTETIVEPANM